ncbi:MAG TPA: glycosyltransferase family 2 protein [Longimicrobiales bacterium]|nr:glycosyltransferase family 2 protein [Longimicrobiales bacterium]
MTAAPLELSVLIVSWNVRDLLCSCIDALHRELDGIAAEIIVVDNASADDTVATLRARYPEIRVIANRDNVGFPLANNQALRLARGEYVLYLNPDTEVGPGSVRGCMAALRADARLGMAGCKLVLEDGSIQLECARRPYLLRHMAMEVLYLHMLLPRSRIFGDHLMAWWDHEGERDVEAICGAFMLVRRAAAEQIGGLPEEVFMYHEDLAFCIRLRRAGWRIRYLGQYSTLHRWRGSSRRSTAKLALLEGEYKIQLLRETQGPWHARAGRVLFAVRSASRLALGALLALSLGWTELGRRFPRVLDWRTHGLQLVWAIAPPLVAHMVPRAARTLPVPAAYANDGGHVN